MTIQTQLTTVASTILEKSEIFCCEVSQVKTVLSKADRFAASHIDDQLHERKETEHGYKHLGYYYFVWNE